MNIMRLEENIPHLIEERGYFILSRSLEDDEVIYVYETKYIDIPELRRFKLP